MIGMHKLAPLGFVEEIEEYSSDTQTWVEHNSVIENEHFKLWTSGGYFTLLRKANDAEMTLFIETEQELKDWIDFIGD